MRLIDLGYPQGKHADIQADPAGWVAVLQDDHDGTLRLVQLDAEGERRSPDVGVPAAGGAAFPRLWVDPVSKHTWLAWRHEQIGGLLLNVTTGQQTQLGLVHGNCPIALGAGHCWYQASAAYNLSYRLLGNPGLVWTTPWLGRPTGLAGVDAKGDPELVDDERLSVPGMVNPQSAGRCTVGEADRAGGPCNVARVTDGREAVIWPGLISNTPRIASDGAAFGVATWGGPGVRVAFLTDPPDFREPVTEPPPVKPPVLPDQPFVVDPHGVVEDISAWLFSPNQGPDVSFSTDGTVRSLLKSDEGSGDGPNQIREWWDRRDGYIGHLEDSSMGRRIFKGKPVTPEQIVKLFPESHAQVWASLPLYRNWWKDGARVWLPQRCVSGYSLKYTTDFSFNTGEVHPNVLIEIRVDVGHGVMNGKEVRVRGAYISSPDHGTTWNAEVNYYGKPEGFNSWIAGPFAAPPEGW